MTDVLPPSAPAASESSRTSSSGAGWHCQHQGTFRKLEPPGNRPKFSWLRPSVLWAARNDTLARVLDDPTDETRRRWVEEQRNRGVDPELRIDRSDLQSYSCLIAGDTGEGDHSQYAVVPAITKIGEGTAFMVLLSDVIYPIGNVNEYVDKFYRPYSRYSAPVYAVPGNHDWYDGLGGFMRHFCGADPLEILRVRRRVFSRDGVRDRLWRKPSLLEGDTMERAHEFRPAPDQRLGQPGPYWILDTGPVQFVGVDTGIIGNLDGDQGDWLKRVSASAKPKILVTGKPLVVNNVRDPGAIADRDFTVDDVVRDPANNYVAAIGGDIHNYQHYPIRVGDRLIHYVVNGGGGAFMHATHTISKASVEGVNEDDFKCYPLRGDSLAFYSRLYSRKLTFGSTLLEIEPKQASALLASRRETVPTRPGGPGKPTTATKLKGLIVGLLPSGRTFHKYLSEFADWDDPPLFKSFLRLDVTADSVRVRCFAASGCLDQELNPPVEDDFTIELSKASLAMPS